MYSFCNLLSDAYKVYSCVDNEYKQFIQRSCFQGPTQEAESLELWYCFILNASTSVARHLKGCIRMEDDSSCRPTCLLL